MPPSYSVSANCVTPNQVEKVKWPSHTLLEHLITTSPDDKTRQLFIRRSEQDEHEDCRVAALNVLTVFWPDKKTNQLLTMRAMQDKNEGARSHLLELLTVYWPNYETRQLLRDRAVQDTHERVRSTALEQLAEHWLDEESRQLLCERAVQDKNEGVRYIAWKNLSRHWLDERTQQLVKGYIQVDGAAACLYGEKHSRFGEFVFYSYEKDTELIDPRQPIPAEHIQKAAKRAGIPPDKIDETVRSLSEHMGWDITKGSKAGKL